MLPKIKAKFRSKNDCNFTIEQFYGKQYRCLKCNSVFFSDKEIFRHFRHCKTDNKNRNSTRIPKINESIQIRIFYTDDYKDYLKQQTIHYSNFKHK